MDESKRKRERDGICVHQKLNQNLRKKKKKKKHSNNSIISPEIKKNILI